MDRNSSVLLSHGVRTTTYAASQDPNFSNDANFVLSLFYAWLRSEKLHVVEVDKNREKKGEFVYWIETVSYKFIPTRN